MSIVQHSLRDFHVTSPTEESHNPAKGSRRSLERQLAELICDWYDRWMFENDVTPDPERLAKKLKQWARDLGY